MLEPGTYPGKIQKVTDEGIKNYGFGEKSYIQIFCETERKDSTGKPYVLNRIYHKSRHRDSGPFKLIVALRSSEPGVNFKLNENLKDRPCNIKTGNRTGKDGLLYNKLEDILAPTAERDKRSVSSKPRGNDRWRSRANHNQSRRRQRTRPTEAKSRTRTFRSSK